jgi:hypothetical protein
MMIYRKVTLAALAGLLIASGASAQPLTLKFLIAAHTRARGGAKTLDAVRTLRDDERIDEPGINAFGRWYGTTDGRMRVDIFSYSGCKRIWSEGLDKDGAWQWPGDEPAPSAESPAGAAALRHSIEFNMFGIHRYAERGNRLRLLGLQNVEGAKLYVLKLTLADGFETYRYLDPRTFLVVRSRDFRSFHPDLDSTKKWLETRYTRFERKGGIVDPVTSETWDFTSNKAIGHGRTVFRQYNPVVTVEMLSRSWEPTPYCTEAAPNGT